MLTGKFSSCTNSLHPRRNGCFSITAKMNRSSSVCSQVMEYRVSIMCYVHLDCHCIGEVIASKIKFTGMAHVKYPNDLIPI